MKEHILHAEGNRHTRCPACNEAARVKRTAVFAQVWRHGQLVTIYQQETGR